MIEKGLPRPEPGHAGCRALGTKRTFSARRFGVRLQLRNDYRLAAAGYPSEPTRAAVDEAVAYFREALLGEDAAE